MSSYNPSKKWFLNLLSKQTVAVEQKTHCFLDAVSLFRAVGIHRLLVNNSQIKLLQPTLNLNILNWLSFYLVEHRGLFGCCLVCLKIEASPAKCCLAYSSKQIHGGQPWLIPCQYCSMYFLWIRQLAIEIGEYNLITNTLCVCIPPLEMKLRHAG